MHREQEYKHLAHRTRKRAGEEENAQLRAQWEILAATYVQLADQSKKIDDTGHLRSVGSFANSVVLKFRLNCLMSGIGTKRTFD